MPIKGLKRDERAVPRAGIIRLGYKTRYCLNQQCKYHLAYDEADTTACPKCGGDMGKQTTAEAGHFILRDAPGVAEALKTDRPTELKIYFPFDDIDKNFPTYRTLFSASSMVCQGDGQHILHAINPTSGQTVVKDGRCIVSFTEKLADGDPVAHRPGDKMPCPALDEPAIYSKCDRCSNRGILLVMLKEVPRMAYFQISTGSIVNLQELPQQMLNIQEVVYELTGYRRLTGVPFILRRVVRSMSPLKKDRQGNPAGRTRVDKYVLQLEVEPEYMLELIRAQRQLVNPMARFALQPGQPVGEVTTEKPTTVFSEPPHWEPTVVEDGEFEPVDEPAPVQPEPPTEPEPPAPKPGKATRPLSAIQLFDFLHRKAGDGNGGPATDKQLGLLAGKLEECFAPDDDARSKRLAVIRWLWGIDTSKDLTLSQAKAMLDWLLAGAQDQTGDYPLHPAAPEEAKRAYREAMIAAGQADMFSNQDLGTTSGGAAYAD